jgi:hypothetical protein
MSITPKNFNRLTVVLVFLAAAMLPIWPYSRWGYAPSVALAAAVIFLFAIRRLARD